MATAKSIVQIDVQDESFKRFHAAFDKYKEALKAMPKDWQKVGQQLGAAGAAIDKNLQKNTKNQKDFNKSMKDGLVTAKEFAGQAKSIAGSFASAAVSIAKWVSLGALGGGFGLAGLASGASNARRQSQGLGLSTGETRAAQTSLSRYIDPMSALKNIVDAQNDVTKRIVFSATGTSPNGKNSLQVLQEILPKMVEAFKAQPESTRYNYANAMHFTDIVSQEDLNRLAHLGKDELPQAMKQMADMAKRFNADDSVNKGWQDFLVNMKAAGISLEVDLQKNLIKLSVPFQNLMKTISKVANELLSSPDMGKWIESLGNGIEKLAKYLSSPEFSSDLMGFMDSLKKFGEVIAWIWDKLPDSGKSDPVNHNTATVKSGITQSPADFLRNMSKGDSLLKLEAQNNLPRGILDTIWALESNRGKNSGSSSKGAMGDFQLMSDTAKGLGVTDRSDFNQSAGGAATMISRLLKKYKGNVERTLEAYNWGEGNLDHYLKGDKSWTESNGTVHNTNHIPKETQDYVRKAGLPVTLIINDATGGNININAAMQGAH
jgi:hypothetical protein